MNKEYKNIYQDHIKTVTLPKSPIEDLKCCGNCKHSNLKHFYIPGTRPCLHPDHHKPDNIFEVCLDWGSDGLTREERIFKE